MEDHVSDEEMHPISTEGSDMTRDIHIALFKDKNRPAARSMPQFEHVMYEDIGKASNFAQPGGFRREHFIAAKQEEGIEPPDHAYTPFMNTVTIPSRLRQATKQLQETYDDFIFATFEVTGGTLDEEHLEDHPESMPLIRRTQRQRSSTAPPSEEESIEALTRKTIFTILKSFIGSGVLFLPKGFQNGGMLFSIVVLFLVAILSTFCMLRLMACSAQLQRRGEFSGGVSYGLVGEIAYGKIGRVAVNVSLVLSQLGFCCSYLIFIERNIRDVIMHCTNCRLIPGPWLMIILQIPIYTPLTWVRKIKYFAITNLFADALILFGLLWIMSYSLEHMETSDVPADWQNFNSDHFGLFLGTAVYVFEGIGLVLPIYNAVDARLKDRFPVLLSNTIIGLVIFLCVFAGIVYASFGIDTQAVVTLNLPNVGINGGTIAVQVAYSIALVLTYPLMMYPALMILEGYCIPTKRGAVK